MFSRNRTFKKTTSDANTWRRTVVLERNNNNNNNNKNSQTIDRTKDDLCNFTITLTPLALSSPSVMKPSNKGDSTRQYDICRSKEDDARNERRTDERERRSNERRGNESRYRLQKDERDRTNYRQLEEQKRTKEHSNRSYEGNRNTKLRVSPPPPPPFKRRNLTESRGPRPKIGYRPRFSSGRFVVRSAHNAWRNSRHSREVPISTRRRFGDVRRTDHRNDDRYRTSRIESRLSRVSLPRPSQTVSSNSSNRNRFASPRRYENRGRDFRRTPPRICLPRETVEREEGELHETEIRQKEEGEEEEAEGERQLQETENTTDFYSDREEYYDDDDLDDIYDLLGTSHDGLKFQ